MAALQEVSGQIGLPLEPNPPVHRNDLPSPASPDLHLVAATPAENLQALLLNGNEWRGPLSVESYIGRECHLLEQDLTRDGRLTAWILTSSNLPPCIDGTRRILAACETIQKNAYVARGGSIEEIVVHGVCSVFTRPEYRGRGYAARMMSELAHHLETYQQQDGARGTLSVLYSDIGRKFYAKFGWKPFLSTHIHLDPLSHEQYEEVHPRIRQNLKKGVPEVHDLTTQDVAELPLMAYVRDELKGQSEVKPNVPYVAIHPDMAHIRWQHAREEYQCQALGLPEPSIKGAIHRETGIAVIWSRVFANHPKDYSIHILHVVIPPAKKVAPTADDHLALAALLLRAQKEAADWKMHAGVEVWDPSGFSISAAQKLRLEEEGNVQVIRRDKEHVCSLKWIGARPGDDPSGDVVWLHNEKYAWC